ncbi:MAG: CoA transferase [Pseudomonadota bacterium]|nr:CoA transferase [Pseudomonadota bacterium]
MSDTLPLSGVRVVDFTHVISGPFCTMMLAHMGADVVKVERPDIGDSLRNIPGYEGREEHPDYFNSVNNTKRSVALDLKNPDQHAAAVDLICNADVVVENFKPGTADRIGLGYEVLKKINSKLIYCSISGFGQTGPYAQRPAIDPIIQAVSGVMSVTGEQDGPPMMTGYPLTDTVAGMYGAFAVVSALIKARASGVGEHLDVSMQGAMLYVLGCRMAETLQAGVVTERSGNQNPFRVPSEVFLSRDRRPTILHCSNNKRWEALCRALEVPEWAENPKYGTMQKRQKHREEIHAMVEARFAERDQADWMVRFDAEEATCMHVHDYQEALDHEQVKYRSQLTSRDHPLDGKVWTVGVPLMDSAYNEAITRPPTLGENTVEILQEWLGWDETKSKNMLQKNG